MLKTIKEDYTITGTSKISNRIWFYIQTAAIKWKYLFQFQFQAELQSNTQQSEFQLDPNALLIKNISVSVCSSMLKKHLQGVNREYRKLGCRLRTNCNTFFANICLKLLKNKL